MANDERIAVKLKDVCESIFSGGTPNTSTQEYWGGEYQWLSSGETRNRFIKNTEKTITESGIENSSTRLAKFGDVLIASAGQGKTRGQTSFALIDTYINQSIIALRTNEAKLYSLYLFYLLSGKYDALRNMSDANAIRGSLTCKMFESMEINIPIDITLQKKVASILFNYDSLIENNARRIEILESMAKLIYEEWFVKFKFPGHKSIKMIDSDFGQIPEGWSIKPMKEVAKVIDCLHSKKPDILDQGYGLFLQLENIGENGRINLAKKFYVSKADYEMWTSRIEVKEGDCVITNVGRVGAVARIPANFKGAIGRNMTAIRPESIPDSFLIQYLLSKHMAKEKSTKVDSGTIMDALNVRNIYKLNLVIPPDPILNAFDGIMRSIRREIDVLLDQNIKLATCRWVLLPKLISGELDVSKLDIKVSEVSA